MEEAIERGLWEQPSEEELARLRDAYMENETALEMRSEAPRHGRPGSKTHGATGHG